VLGAAGFVVDGNAGVEALDDLGAGRFDGQIRRQGKNLLARGHDLADGHIIQFEGAVNERLLKAGQYAHAAGGGGDQLEFLGRVDLGALGHGNVEAAQDDGGRALEEAHGGAGQGHEEEHGRRHGDGEGLGAAQGERLGHQFADHHVEVGDDGEADDDGGDGGHVGIGMGMGRGLGQSGDPAEKDGGGQRFADPAQSQRAERDAELHGGEKVVQIALQAANGARSGDLGGEHLLDAGVADGDQGELGGHKEGVGQNEQGHGDKFEQGETVHYAVRIALRRGSLSAELAELAGLAGSRRLNRSASARPRRGGAR
jgi:hypothetical protein